MQSVIEIKENRKKVVSFVRSQEEFLIYIKKCVDEMYVSIENMTYNEFIKTKSFKPGKYMLINTNNIIYLEKAVIINKGMVYNTTNFGITILITWELIHLTTDATNVITNLVALNEININKTPTLENNGNNENKSDKAKEIDNLSDNTDTYINSINEFNITNMSENSSICIIGKRGSASSAFLCLCCLTAGRS